MITIGDRIKKRRKELNLTQLQLAEKLNVTDRAVSKWEQNDGNPDFSILSTLAEVLDVTLDYLIAGKTYRASNIENEENVEDENQDAIVKCKQCGERLPRGVQYCPICGMKVSLSDKKENI